MDRTFYVYMLASVSRIIYVGVTNNLFRRVTEHGQKQKQGFTQKYNVTKLVWFERYGTAWGAIAREKEIKKWRRAKKVALIEAMNPDWKDLSAKQT
jgi:putative endonuclease